MTNALIELCELIDTAKILCAKIMYQKSYDEKKVIIFKQGQDIQEFMEEMDFEYHSGFGTQQLYGTIWLKDGTWMVRGEYDGSEWWEHVKKPEIPEELK